MHNTTHLTRENRTVTVDVHNDATTVQLLGDGKAFLAYVLACVMSLGLQLTHKATCHRGGDWTHRSHSLRIHLGGVPLSRLQYTMCTAVLTVLLHPALSPDVPRRGS